MIVYSPTLSLLLIRGLRLMRYLRVDLLVGVVYEFTDKSIVTYCCSKSKEKAVELQGMRIDKPSNSFVIRYILLHLHRLKVFVRQLLSGG